MTKGFKRGKKFIPTGNRKSSVIHSSDVKDKTVRVINGKRYCGGNGRFCGNLLENGQSKCMYCQGYHRVVDEPKTKKLNKFNRFGQVKVWKWEKN